MYMLRFFATTILVFASSLMMWAKSDIDDLYTYENNTYAGININYRKVEIGDSAHIVVLYLHGGSGQGNDNKSHMKAPAISDIYNYLKDNGFSFTMLVPQVSNGQQWQGMVIPALKEMLDKYSENGKSSIYILGGSMGGLGIWNMLYAYPGYFQGAMPVAFDTPKGKADKFVGTKIYSVIGAYDRRRNIKKCKSFFEKFTKQGGKAKFDIENSWGHRQTCEWSFTPERLKWLFE